MISHAKTSLSAVKTFRMAASSVRDYSAKIDDGIKCLEELFTLLTESKGLILDQADKCSSAEKILDKKIKSIEKKLANLTSQINRLEEQLSGLEGEKSSIPESKTITDENGESHEESNPAYDVLTSKITEIQSEIDSIQSEIDSIQALLEHANEVHSRLESHMDVLNGIAYSLQEKMSSCKQLIFEIETIKSENDRQGVLAVESLKKLEAVIAEYLRVKMDYTTITIPRATEAFSNLSNSQHGFNVNININTRTVQQQTIIQNNVIQQTPYTDEEVRDHQIEFNQEGKVVLYDGKTFGGKYNSYETRVGQTMVDDNPVLGQYEGDRGESKFIPSNRSAEGIVVIEILREYGLDGIIYRNAEPDFEKCSKAVVKISGMTEHRENFTNKNDEQMLGNFSQADIELSKKWNETNRNGKNDWTPRNVFEYRKRNKLTWHEKCDTETMVLVRGEINLFFKHSGGCSECKARDSVQPDNGGFDE